MQRYRAHIADYQGADWRLKHLEMIQAVIGRLGNDSFLVKGWAITVAGAFFGFAVSSTDGSLAVAAALPTLAFWALDSYYLWAERLFRELYDQVRKESDQVDAFYMAATTEEFGKTLEKAGRASVSRWDTFWSRTLCGLYLPIIGTAVVLMALLCFS